MSEEASPCTDDAADVWDSLGLSFDKLAFLDASYLTDAPASILTADDAEGISRAPRPSAGLEVALSRATVDFVDSARDALHPTTDPKHLKSLDDTWYIEALDRLADEFDSIDSNLAACEEGLADIQQLAKFRESKDAHVYHAESHLSTFIDSVILEPSLVRHIVDGRIDDDRYVGCLRQLGKKQAVLDMSDIQRAACYDELKSTLDKLILTASSRVTSFLLCKIDLLRRPSTNVQIIKENVLLRYCDHVRFLDELAHEQFLKIRSAYIEIMAPLYLALFRKYASGLMSLKAFTDGTSDACVGTVSQQSSALSLHPQTLAAFFGSSTQAASDPVVTGSSPVKSVSSSANEAQSSPRKPRRSFTRRNSIGERHTTASAAPARQGLFTLGNRIDVLAKIDSPPIVLAVAESNGFKFYYEELQRSLGRMLSETCASEHKFCAVFLGESGGRMFGVLFKDVLNALMETVSTHAAESKDMIGILLALKVNEAQRKSMAHRNIMDLSDYFIRVDIALKPKFKKIFDFQVNSLTEATKTHLKALFPGQMDHGPHAITRQFAELSAAILTIASYGPDDDAILEGLRRMRTEYYGFVTAMSALYAEPKSRYIFLVNNTDLVLATYTSRGLTSSADTRYFSEVQVGHTASYVEHEVYDHFPSLISFVRTCERAAVNSERQDTSASGTVGGRALLRKENSISEDTIRQILREFASNWHLGVLHMRDSILRAFPNFRTGNDILRAMFARLLAYYRKCEAVVNSTYPGLRSELVSTTEISFEIRQVSKGFA